MHLRHGASSRVGQPVVFVNWARDPGPTSFMGLGLLYPRSPWPTPHFSEKWPPKYPVAMAMHPAAMPARTPGAWFPWRCIDRKYLITTARFPETWTAATLLLDRLTSSGHSAEPANIVGTEAKRPIPTNLPRILNDMSHLWRSRRSASRSTPSVPIYGPASSDGRSFRTRSQPRRSAGRLGQPPRDRRTDPRAATIVWG